MDDDRRDIENIIARQFRSLNWGSEQAADWDAFISDFLPGALLYPAARPVKSQTPVEFVKRMEGLASSRLQSFREDVLGYRIQVFGNVAVAFAGCRITENETTESRSVEMMLLTKENGIWHIVAQAWDNESDSKKLPPELAGP